MRELSFDEVDIVSGGWVYNQRDMWMTGGGLIGGMLFVKAGPYGVAAGMLGGAYLGGMAYDNRREISDTFSDAWDSFTGSDFVTNFWNG